MAKNREQLVEEATKLNIDFSAFETNREFQDAINATKPTQEPKEAKKEVTDRSAYNCTACAGEGLEDVTNPLTKLCPVCGGTGKV